ncbi:hypothetical protein F5Y03DRAFT_41952 [Xylaria venustula]|nr:hypothetical protein F5Y03DRAFT_41952 [Xylaria venustula]
MMERPLICASLRKRLDWASLPAALLQSHSLCGKWKETQLGTHDLAIPLTTTQRVFRAIFLSPSDIATASDSSRIERLYSLNAGQDSGILFLLKHENEQSAIHALMKLQLQLVGKWELPIIPVDSVAAVPATLVTIQSHLSSPVANRKPPIPASHLLPFCSDDVPLAEHAVNILTDTTSGFRDLLDKLSSSAEFESEIVQLLGNDANKFRNFWANDYLVD